jgi:hypothetical protein
MASMHRFSEWTPQKCSLGRMPTKSQIRPDGQDGTLSLTHFLDTNVSLGTGVPVAQPEGDGSIR